MLVKAWLTRIIPVVLNLWVCDPLDKPLPPKNTYIMFHHSSKITVRKE